MQENSHIGEVSEAIEKLGVNFRCTIWYLYNVNYFLVFLSIIIHISHHVIMHFASILSVNIYC